MLIVIKGSEELIHKRLINASLDKEAEVRVTDEPSEEDFLWLREEDLFSTEKALVIKIHELKANEEFKALLEKYKDAGVIILSIYKGSDNLKIMKWLKENAKIKNASELNETDFNSFLSEEIKSYNVNISKDTLPYLKERLCYGTDGIDLMRIDIWLRMLSYFDSVTQKEIDDIVKVSGTQTAFDLVRFIGNGDKEKAINTVIGKGKDAIAILSTLQWAIRLSIKLKLFSPAEVGVTSWQTNNLKAFIAKDMPKLDKAYNSLTEAILSIKKGMPAESILVREVANMFVLL